MQDAQSERVLVRGEISWVFHLLRAIGPILVVVGIILGFQVNDGLDDFFFYGGLIVTGIMETIAFFKRRSRVWCTDLGHGFAITELGEDHTFADADVLAMSLWDKKIFNNGNAAGIQRDVRYWVIDRDKPIVMNYRIKDDRPDGVVSLHNRLLDMLEHRATEALDRGEHAAGEGWAISKSALAVGTSQDSLIPFDKLQAVDVYGDQVCIWRVDDEHASIKFPIKGRNSYLLIRLLGKMIPEQNANAAPANGLGRVLFERATRFNAVGWVLAIIVTILSLLLFVVHPLLGLAAPLVVIAFSVLIYFYCERTSFRCHDQGVFQSGMTGHQKIRYEDVESFTYSATRMYYNGAYTGTQTQMTFDPLPGSGASRINYSANIRGADDDLDVLRNHVSQVIGSRMLREIADGRPVAWTPAITFHNDHLEFVPTSFFGGKKTPVQVPWNQIVNFDIQEGTFHLWQRGSDKSVIHEPVSNKNFFPGFFAFCQILSPEAAAEEELVEAE
ncbi:hypothetical protein LOC68_27745 [Blastopirellula sp. JC732]|uniref:Uncharacterized protein n=1 Tax=Blastopirellula sediminis TaxID=2894196 RepID=A0A9X1MSZ4_9BACT|nr:hypothetical protein [Blastopirellula sediminis]MCC9604495.1 hypothetical protein [Blastopirellula sediminis]MCC9632206.1 hypothetical protein [Blastopirellula sediminis]